MRLWFGASDGIRAEIIYRGEVAGVIYLDEKGYFSIPQLPQIEFLAEDGAVAFIRSDCPDQVCVNTGWIRIPGDFAACLPNEVLLRIATNSAAGLDIVTG